MNKKMSQKIPVFMKKKKLSLLTFSMLSVSLFLSAQQTEKQNMNGETAIVYTSSEYELWYKQSASVWEEALPIGNGRLGAMIFGDPAKEKLQLNDITIWSGSVEASADIPEAYKHLP